jgi:hypothetical protein
LSELNLTTAPIKLTDFVAEKGNPTETLDRYLVLAAWFKVHFGTEEITADHMFTAYRHLGWQSAMPNDPTQPLRDLKAKKNWFDKGGKGAYKINWSGENTVSKMGASK